MAGVNTASPTAVVSPGLETMWGRLDCTTVVSPAFRRVVLDSTSTSSCPCSSSRISSLGWITGRSNYSNSWCMRCSHLLYSAILFEKNALTTVRSLCKKQNKMRNKFLQIEYIHPYIIWCIDSFLSVISSFSIFLFSHYLINININFNQQPTEGMSGRLAVNE